MEVADARTWKLQVRHVAKPATVDRSVLWNNMALSYEQHMFGQCTSLEYSSCGRYLAATGTNHSMVLRGRQMVGVCTSLLWFMFFTWFFRPYSWLVGLCVDHRVTLRSTETAFERHFEGHTRDARDAAFMSKNMVVSGSDDGTIRFWDVGRDNELGSSDAHGDYVRTVDVVSENIVLSGGYDRNIRVWDIRVGLDAPVAAFATGKPVEKVVFMSSKNLGAAATGDTVSIFDLRRINTKKGHGDLIQVQSLAIHSKTVAGLAYSAEHDTLITGAFDGRVKFVSLRDGASFKEEASRTFSHPVTSLSLHPEAKELAVGQGDGHVAVYTIATTTAAPGKPDDMTRREAQVVTDRLIQIRRLLSVYQYHRALRVALFSRHRDVIATTLEDLQRRCVLHVALSGHNDRAIAQVLRFVVQHLDDPDLHRICIATLDLIFEIYGAAASKSPFFHRELLRAHKRIGDMNSRLESLQQCVGTLELVLDEF
jgi:U3 small nucleolar RNA-associated protein 15